MSHQPSYGICACNKCKEKRAGDEHITDEERALEARVIETTMNFCDPDSPFVEDIQFSLEEACAALRAFRERKGVRER